MPWDQKTIGKYHTYATTYLSTFSTRIDCADLALALLVDFAAANSLPVRLKYYSGGWKYYTYEPRADDSAKFKKKVKLQLGALNVIDNTVSTPIATAKAGDLIMTKWSGTLGHTRLIYSVKSVQDKEKTRKYEVEWYQGNLPAVVPVKKKQLFSEITHVYGNAPRRWNFAQFDK